MTAKRLGRGIPPLFALLLPVVSAFGSPSTAEASSPEETELMNGYDCHAYTQCPQGGGIACHVYGSSTAGVRCSWHVVPYRSVLCEGMDGYGAWQRYYFTCY